MISIGLEPLKEMSFSQLMAFTIASFTSMAVESDGKFLEKFWPSGFFNGPHYLSFIGHNFEFSSLHGDRKKTLYRYQNRLKLYKT